MFLSYRCIPYFLRGYVVTAIYPNSYSPDLLLAIPRSEARKDFSPEILARMQGADLWNCYELSWLTPEGVPAVAMLKLEYPADSPALVESKSLKLYLMSLNQKRLSGPAELRELILSDLSLCLGTREILLDLVHPDEYPVTGFSKPAGDSLDSYRPEEVKFSYCPEVLQSTEVDGGDRIYSHLLRSVCPITGQPDYGTVEIFYEGKIIDRESLLKYIVGFRSHGDYHEHCCELFFRDLLERCSCTSLAVRCTYTRRGGIDISPSRWTPGNSELLPFNRLARH